MSPDDELMGLAFVLIYLFLAPTATALWAVPLGTVYGVLAGLRSRRNALSLIAVPALLAALVVTILSCGLPLLSFTRQEGLPSNELFPVVVGTLVTFTVALVVWSLPIGAAVSVGRVFAIRGWKPTIVTLAAALLLAILIAAALPAIFLVPTSPLFSEQAPQGDWILPATMIFGSTFALSCIFFGPMVRFVGRTLARAKEPELPLPLDPLVERPMRQMKWTRHQRILIAVLASAVVAVFGCLGAYLFGYFPPGVEEVPPSPAGSPHPLALTSTPMQVPLAPTPQGSGVAPTAQAPAPTNTLVIPQTPTMTPRPCPPAPTAQMAPQLLELWDSVETDEERLMVEFLMSRYDPSLGLLEESPIIGAGRFFVHADAYLAGLDTSSYDECYHLEPSPHWRVFRDRLALPEEEIMWGLEELDLGGGVHSYQHDADTVMPLGVWADRLLLAALSAEFAGDHVREEELLAQAREMWDGKCVRDEYYRWHEQEYGYPACETFKTALYYHLTGDEDALAILTKMQETDPASPNYGGIYNLYDQNGDRFPPGVIDANSETTAVVLLTLHE
jgi:MFS family permease